MRQHGDGAIRKVNAGAADTGFEIERRAGMDILGYIGNVDLKLVTAIGALADENGVVEVACRLAVDGDDGERAEIDPLIGNVGIDNALTGVRDPTRFGEDGFGKDTRKLMLADHHLHVNAEVVWMPKNFNDTANGRARGCGPTGDLDVDDEAVNSVWALRAFGFWIGSRFTAKNPMRRGSC